MVGIPPMAQHIAVAWEWPAIRRMLERLGPFSRYVHFDKRGTGLSDRRSQVPGVDERVDDRRAVMDDASDGSARSGGSQSSKSTSQCLPLQNGLFWLAPQRHKV